MYVYGEPLPSELSGHLPLPDYLPAESTSSLLWVATCGSCSPLHYDLSEGVMLQIHGRKQFLLIPPTDLQACYPYPVAHPHDRQSRINDVHQPDLEKYPHFGNLAAVQATLEPGQLLYIPYGWWHQVESSGVNISVSYRWNPYEDALRVAALASRRFGLASMPAPVATQMYESFLTGIPAPIQAVLLQRFRQQILRQ
eukprot:TRINITY_DN4042_c0_g2_i1.p1 TRINITY_DN4042_c0_g2~~TRINITY_DN4042_c0_g2_i1.p1  ORF type:complete len:197 (+),score=11.01 TRINITY_DN4042_c0_g2_i1:163-753(+)